MDTWLILQLDVTLYSFTTLKLSKGDFLIAENEFLSPQKSAVFRKFRPENVASWERNYQQIDPPVSQHS